MYKLLLGFSLSHNVVTRNEMYFVHAKKTKSAKKDYFGNNS